MPTPTIKNYIGGKWVAASTQETIEDIGPATGMCIAHIPRSGQRDVQDAVAATQSDEARAWGRTTPAHRADILDEIAAGLSSRMEELASLESLDQGKPVSLALKVDIPRAIQNFRFFAGLVRNYSDNAHMMDGALNYTLRNPVGTVGLITPWNLPLYLLSWKTAPALAMGNTIVAKPSELTPLTANALAEIIHDSNLPAGVFNLLHGYGHEVGQAIVAHPKIKGISFTGGTATGRKVAATAAPLFKKLSLELGGKNPTIVFADAPFEQTVEGAARAGFANQGEICLCGSRLLVQEEIYDSFLAAFIRRVNARKVGNPKDEDTQIGALVSAAHRDKIQGYIELGVKEGGVIHCGGGPPSLPSPYDSGFFMNPTVIGELPINSRTATEEIFGPVVTVHRFRTEKEAIEMANSVEYGLAASVWTSDLQRAHRVGHALETGMVWVNTWLLRDLRVPFGGMKNSGVGREGGKWSLEFFSEARNICISYQ